MEALRKDLSRLKGYAEKQSNVLQAFTRAIQNREELNGFMEKLDDCDDADEFNNMLKAYMSGDDPSPDS